MTKKRNPLIAALLGVLSPGLGFLYVGKPLLAVGLPVAAIVIVVLTVWMRLIFNPEFTLGLAALGVVVWLGAVIAAGAIAYRQGETSLRKFQRWYVYVGFLATSWIVGSVWDNVRGEWFGYEPYRMPSGSMANTLLLGDFIVTDAWKYRSNGPKRGDVVTFRFPPKPSVYYIKRVIGLPGDRVDIRNGAVHVNGELLTEPYITSELNRRSSQESKSYQVPSDAYFLLGDNRDHSNDSRYWGFVPAKNIMGHVEYIYFSWDPRLGLRSSRIGQFVR